jgi:hypothetical protein
VFTVFVILCSVVAAYTFEAGYRREFSSLHRAMILDTTRAVASSVQTELNNALRTVIQAAMYEAGRRGQDKPQVESRIRAYINERISAGWSYSNFRSIEVPSTDADSLRLEWLPDGGLRAYGYLGAEFEHLGGVKAFGVKLDAGVVPRYGRLHHLAYMVYEQAAGVPDLEAFEAELNENYACEFLVFELGLQNGSVTLTVTDAYGGRAIAEE